MRLFCSFFLLMLKSFCCLSAQEDTAKIRNPYKWQYNEQGRLWQQDYPALQMPDKSYKLFDEQPAFYWKQPRIAFTIPNGKKNRFNMSSPGFLLSTAFISYGLLAQDNLFLRQLDEDTHQEVSETWGGRYPIDDYLQFAPYIATYALDFAGLKAKHNLRDRTIVMLTSYIIMSGTIVTFKNSFDVRRPDSSKDNSFASGHTATAFLGAHILCKEYKDASPWVGVMGYASAAMVGSLRVINKRHWVSDVVAGAGIGILSAELGYKLLPVFHKMFGLKDSRQSLVIGPVVAPDNYGVALAYCF